MGYKPTDNSDFEGKVQLRQWLLDQLGGVKKLGVLECFGGEGHLHDACYTQAKKHMAFELRAMPHRPTWISGDNQILLEKHVQGWDLYDLDAYASPWYMAHSVCRLRGPGRFGIVATCCTNRTLRAGNMMGYERFASGYGKLPNSPLLVRFYDDIIRCVVNEWFRFGVQFEKGKRLRSAARSSPTRYYAFVLNKQGA